MRHSLILAVLLTFFIFGCTENSSLVNPGTESNNLEWISLQSNSLAKITGEDLVFTKLIDPEKGGTIKIKVKDDISIKGKLKVPKNSFDGEASTLFKNGEASTLFTIQLAPDIFTIDFDPSGLEFDPDLTFSIVYKDVNLDESDKNIKFGYLHSDGTIQIVEDAKLIIDINNGILGVKNVKIDHFSRYGFVK